MNHKNLLTWVTNFSHFLDLSLKLRGELVPFDSSLSLPESLFSSIFPFSNSRTASMIALLCCPCPYIKNSGVRPNLMNEIKNNHSNYDIQYLNVGQQPNNFMIEWSHIFLVLLKLVREKYMIIQHAETNYYVGKRLRTGEKARSH